MQRTNYLPLADFYARAGVTPELLAKVRKEALEAKTERLLKVKGGVSPALLPQNMSIIALGHEETVLLHTTVDHRTRLEAAEAVAEELNLKPAKKVDVAMTIAIKAPGATLFHDFESGFIMAVKEFVGKSTCWVLVGQFQSLGTEPLHVDHSNQAIRKDSTNGCLRLKVFESGHVFWLTYLSLLAEWEFGRRNPSATPYQGNLSWNRPRSTNATDHSMTLVCQIRSKQLLKMQSPDSQVEKGASITQQARSDNIRSVA